MTLYGIKPHIFFILIIPRSSFFLKIQIAKTYLTDDRQLRLSLFLRIYINNFFPAHLFPNDKVVVFT